MTKQSKHIKRMAIPKIWPLAKKGSKYVMKPKTGKNIELCLPICIIFREILGLVKTRKEMKQILNLKEVLINNKIVNDVNKPVGFFDIISIPRINKYYRLEISKNKKLAVLEISEKDSYKKPYKVIGKTVLKRGRIQLNLYEGANFIMNKDIKNVDVDDTIIADIKQNKIISHVPLKQGSFAWIIKGKHIGNKGEIINFDGIFVTIKTEGEQIKTAVKNIYLTN